MQNSLTVEPLIAALSQVDVEAMSIYDMTRCIKLN